MIHSFLLIGQSNMAGRGFISEAIPVDRTHIKILRNGRWQMMFRPITPDRDRAGVSLAESFAEAYANKYGVDVGLICCADGGTSLEQWQVGGVLYDNAVFQAKLAQRTSTIVGVLWHQGEADCRVERASTYRERFELIMASMRRELGLDNTPFVLGELGEFLAECDHDEYLKNYRMVNDQLASVAENNPYTACVSAAGLGSNPDKIHFNSAALHEFGLREFAEFDKLYEPTSVKEVKPSDTERSAMELL